LYSEHVVVDCVQVGRGDVGVCECEHTRAAGDWVLGSDRCQQAVCVDAGKVEGASGLALGCVEAEADDCDICNLLVVSVSIWCLVVLGLVDPLGQGEEFGDIHSVDLLLHAKVGCIHRVVSVLENLCVALGLEGDVLDGVSK